MNQKQILGKYGEDLAANYLIDRGYKIIERNWRCSIGEIDLIAKDKNQIVFVEVKTRSSTDFGHPLDAITEKKIIRMQRLVCAWCAARNKVGAAVRLDAISVLIRSGRVAVEHLKQVY